MRLRLFLVGKSQGHLLEAKNVSLYRNALQAGIPTDYFQPYMSSKFKRKLATINKG